MGQSTLHRRMPGEHAVLFAMLNGLLCKPPVVCPRGLPIRDVILAAQIKNEGERL